METVENKTNYEISNEALDKLQKDMSEIKVALLGNEYNPQGALVKIAEHEVAIAVIKKRINKAVWTAIGAGTGAGGIISIAYKFLVGLTI